MIQCDLCDEWYHFDCIKLDEDEISEGDDFFCDRCKPKEQPVEDSKKRRGSQSPASTPKKTKGENPAKADPHAAAASPSSSPEKPAKTASLEPSAKLVEVVPAAAEAAPAAAEPDAAKEGSSSEEDVE